MVALTQKNFLAHYAWFSRGRSHIVVQDILKKFANININGPQESEATVPLRKVDLMSAVQSSMQHTSYCRCEPLSLEQHC